MSQTVPKNYLRMSSPPTSGQWGRDWGWRSGGCGWPGPCPGRWRAVPPPGPESPQPLVRLCEQGGREWCWRRRATVLWPSLQWERGPSPGPWRSWWGRGPAPPSRPYHGSQSTVRLLTSKTFIICPHSDSLSASALQLQLFTAFQCFWESLIRLTWSRVSQPPLMTAVRQKLPL